MGRLTRGLVASLLLLLALDSLTVSADTVQTLVMPGKVIQGHADIEGQCKKCHQPFKKQEQDALCTECHKEVRRDVAARIGFHGHATDKPCRECHAEHKGRAARIVILDQERFDHTLTNFVLRDRHGNVKCRDCHAEGKKFRQAPHECNACHKKDDVHHGKLGTDCAGCHNEALWKEVRFDHDKTRFKLTGKHVQPKCTACHRDQSFKTTPRECVGCHRKDDTHKGSLGPNCANCHSDRGWKEALFDHQKTLFPLNGKHGAVKCDACHRDQAFKQTPHECVACHRKNDVHKGTLGGDCDKCHNDRGWKQSSFDHERTHFPLLGAHATTRCLACHKSQAFNDKPPTVCNSCHQKDDTHKGRFGGKCETCHAEKAWKPTKFDHERDTRYPLRDAHRSVKCDACHSGNLYVDKTPAECNGCHAQKDVHRGSLGKRCESCHRESAWKATTFDHARNTRYPLLGRHAEISCKSCHLDGSFSDKLKTECITCHRKDDKHANQEGPQCERCHQESSWKKTNFDHGRASFALTGQHLKVPCGKCHADARFRDAKKACAACHDRQDVHKRRLGATCDNCHNSRDWRIWDFDHEKRTHFVLDGAHRKLVCVDCHTKAAERLPTLSGRCIDCHERDDVHHDGFGTQCDRCHGTSTFKDAKR
jgi:Zn finger protein HypA/HybF involved in hydrogenase expression